MPYQPPPHRGHPVNRAEATEMVRLDMIAGLTTAGFDVSPVLGDGPEDLHVIVLPEDGAQSLVYVRLSENA